MLNNVMDQDRVSFIEARISATRKLGLLSAWPRRDKELPLVDLEVDWVRFSTLNHRTRAEQKREIHIAGQLDLFTNDPMGEKTQRRQYGILASQENFDLLKADIDERGQQEPAVVTFDGILINGNRRVAALRSLLHDDKNLKHRYVSCLVLPVDASALELVQLETELQVAKDFKQDYSWINQALLIEELVVSNGRNFEIVASLMHRKAKEIREDFDKIQQVNQLVDLSRGKWLHLDFEPHESAFSELSQHIRSKNDDERESVRDVYFLGTLADVNYRELRKLRRADAAQLVDDELRAEPALKDLVAMIESAAPKADESDSLLDDVLGPQKESLLTKKVLEFVATLEKSSPVLLPNGTKLEATAIYNNVQRSIENAAFEAEEQRKDVDAGQAPMIRIQKAISDLERAKDALPVARSMPEWREAEFQRRVAAVQQIVMELKVPE